MDLLNANFYSLVKMNLGNIKLRKDETKTSGCEEIVSRSLFA